LSWFLSSFTENSAVTEVHKHFIHCNVPCPTLLPIRDLPSAWCAVYSFRRWWYMLKETISFFSREVLLEVLVLQKFTNHGDGNSFFFDRSIKYYQLLLRKISSLGTSLLVPRGSHLTWVLSFLRFQIQYKNWSVDWTSGIQCKTWGFHGGDYEEWRFPGRWAVWLL
jgi:hypothetical protein